MYFYTYTHTFIHLIYQLISVEIKIEYFFKNLIKFFKQCNILSILSSFDLIQITLIYFKLKNI